MAYIKIITEINLEDFEEFTSIINENALDKEEFEEDRYCLIINKEDN